MALREHKGGGIAAAMDAEEQRANGGNHEAAGVPAKAPEKEHLVGLCVDIPESLRLRLKLDSVTKQVSMRQLIIEALQAKYDL